MYFLDADDQFLKDIPNAHWLMEETFITGSLCLNSFIWFNLMKLPRKN